MMFHRAPLMLVICAFLLQACVQPTPTPTPVWVYRDAYAVGRLVLQDGCLRLQTGTKSWQLVWPDTYTVTVRGETVFIEGPRGSFTATLGQEVAMGGGALFSYTAIQRRRAQGAIPPQCEGPYWEVGLEIRPYLRIDGVLEKEGRCWWLRAEDGRVYQVVWTGGIPMRENEKGVTYGVYEEQEGEMVFVPRVTYRAGDRVHVEGELYRDRWRGGNVPQGCPGPYLVVDTIRHVEGR